MTDNLSSRAEHWARTLTAIPSVTGSQDEADFSTRLIALLRGTPAFAAPDSIWTLDVAGAPAGRQCVMALARGSGRRTVVMTGHFDIVETGCYGELQPLALLLDELGQALSRKIGRSRTIRAPRRRWLISRAAHSSPGAGCST